jgi:hypothetical protein
MPMSSRHNASAIEMGNFTQVREDENPAVALRRFALGGIGWTLSYMGIGVSLIL